MKQDETAQTNESFRFWLLSLVKNFPVFFSIFVLVFRFGIIAFGISIFSKIGINGWFGGLFTNFLCAVYAIALVAALGWFGKVGLIKTAWKSPHLLLPLFFISLLWLWQGFENLQPGWYWWALTLFLVGVNEEIISRGIILFAVSQKYSVISSVAITSALFGLQHLSKFWAGNLPMDDVLWICLSAGLWGFAVGAVKIRSLNLLPLIFLHGFEDWTQILSPGALPFPVQLGVGVFCLIYGLFLLRKELTFRF